MFNNFISDKDRGNFTKFQMPMMNNIDENWTHIYNTNFLRNNFMQNEKNDKKEEVMKINILFRTGKGSNVNIIIDIEKTISELIQTFLQRIKMPELFGKEKSLYFIYNATRINHNDTKKIKDVFHYSQPVVYVNDTRDLIGA
jgi:hypothetical protein